jgi:hypothetical protein
MSRLIKGTSKPPTPKPQMAIPQASPILSRNQLATAVINTVAVEALIPRAIKMKDI